MNLVCRRATCRGISLVEAMIAFGLLLAALYCTYRILGTAFHVDRSSARYLQALYACSAAVTRVDLTPWSRLPPELIRIESADSRPVTHRLAHPHVVPDSEELRWADGSPFAGQYHLDDRSGTLTIASAKRIGILAAAYAYRSEEAEALRDSRVEVSGRFRHPTARSAQAPDAKRKPEARPNGLPPKLLTVTISWNDRGRERSLDLSTLRAR